MKLIRDQSTFRWSIYWSSNLKNLSANHTRYNSTIGHKLYGILRDDSHFAQGKKLRAFTTKIKDWNKHWKTLKSYFTFSQKYEQKIHPSLRLQQWIKPNYKPSENRQVTLHSVNVLFTFAKPRGNCDALYHGKGFQPPLGAPLCVNFAYGSPCPPYLSFLLLTPGALICSLASSTFPSGKWRGNFCYTGISNIVWIATIVVNQRHFWCRIRQA